MKKNRIGRLNLALSLIFFISLINFTSIITKAETANRPEFDVEITEFQASSVVGEEIIIKGKMTPKPFESEVENYQLSNINMEINLTEECTLNTGGNTISLDNIVYKNDKTKKGKVLYKAEPIEFEFKVKTEVEGDYKLFDEINIAYPWKDDTVTTKANITENFFITVKSNENPNIFTKLISEGVIQADKDDEIEIKYMVEPESFTSSKLAGESGKIDEVIFIIDLSSEMKENQRVEFLQNGIENKVLSRSELNLTKFGVIGYSNSVLIGDRNYKDNPKNVAMKNEENVYNLLKPLFDINDGESKDGFRQIFQNGHFKNSIVNSNERNIDKALSMAKSIFGKFGEKKGNKAVILINSGEVNYSKEIVNKIKEEGYKIISLDLSITSDNNLKYLHTDLGGVISDIESESDFLIAKSDGGKVNFPDEDMKKVADRIIAGAISANYEAISQKIYFNLNDNFEYIINSNSSNISVLEYSNNNLSFSLKPIEYKYSGKMIDGKYEYTAEKQYISFKIKVKENKTGELTFAENPNILDKNNYKNYTTYNKFNKSESKEIIMTPTILVKDNDEIKLHGLYNGIKEGQVNIEEDNNGKLFEIAQDSTVTFGSEISLGGNSTEFQLNVNNNFNIINTSDIKIYKISKDSLGNSTLKEIEYENKTISSNGDNQFKIAINNIKENNDESLTEILVVYKARVKKNVASGQELINEIKFSNPPKKAIIITPWQSDNVPILPDLF